MIEPILINSEQELMELFNKSIATCPFFTPTYQASLSDLWHLAEEKDLSIIKGTGKFEGVYICGKMRLYSFESNGYYGTFLSGNLEFFTTHPSATIALILAILKLEHVSVILTF